MSMQIPNYDENIEESIEFEHTKYGKEKAVRRVNTSNIGTNRN